MKISSIALATTLLVGSFGIAAAQDARVAPSYRGLDLPQRLPNGEVAPRPSREVTGGVGGQEVANENAQTRSGGPTGGSITQQ